MPYHDHPERPELRPSLGCRLQPAVRRPGRSNLHSPNIGNVTAQPFFEAALGGPNSAYCAGFANCTAAMVKNEASNIKSTNVYQTWVDLSQKSSWMLPRSLLAQTGSRTAAYRRVRFHQLTGARQLQRRIRFLHGARLARADGQVQLHLWQGARHRQRGSGQQLDHGAESLQLQQFRHLWCAALRL